MPKLRILLIADVPPNPDSGASGTEFQTVAALRRAGHHVECIWSDGLSHQISHGNLHSLFEQPRSYRSNMLSRLSRQPFDVVHANQPQGYLAARALRESRIDTVFVHRSHGFEPRVNEALKPWLRNGEVQRSSLRRAASSVLATLLERQYIGISRWADGHVVSSSLCARFLVERYGVESSRVAVVAQAPPPLFAMSQPSVPDGNRLRKLLYVGQFAFVKAPAIVASMFSAVADAYPDTTLTWVCDKAHHDAVRAQFDGKLLDRVHCMPWMSQSNLLEVYDSHGVFIFPSFFEGFGKALVEAMSRGLIVLASSEGGARDLLISGHNGFQCPPGDIDCLVKAYSWIRDHEERAEAISSAASTLARGLSWDRIAAELAEFYARLMVLRRGELEA